MATTNGITEKRSIKVKSQSQTRISSGLLDLVGGTIGGMIGIFAGQPLDTIRVRLQSQSYAGTLDCLNKTIKNEGALALYKGTVPPLLANCFSYSIAFVIFGQLNLIQRQKREKEFPLSPRGTSTLKEVFLSGLGVGAAQSLLITPADVVKCRLQSQYKKSLYSGPMDCLLKVWKISGISGVYRGFSATALREVPTWAVLFWANEFCKRKIFSKPNGEITQLGIFCSAGLAGVLSWIVIYPFDIVKSRIQTDNLISPKYKGTYDCFVQSWKEEGAKVFTKGLSATLIRAFIMDGACFVGYEFVMKMFKNMWPESF